MLLKMLTRMISATVLVTVSAFAVQELDWLVVSTLDFTPTIVSTSGLGTAHAVAEARVDKASVEAWCAEQGTGTQVAKCVRERMASEEIKKTYRATADCTKGWITTTDGEVYGLAGVWDDSDIGEGRSMWRDSSGQVVGRDNASGGLGISQQWEVLCPGPLKIRKASGNPPEDRQPAAATSGNAATAAGSPAAAKAAGSGNPPVCVGVPFCEEVNDFAVTITDFRASLKQPTKVLTATLRFRNKSDRAIVLGYLPGSGMGTDERNNRYVANDNDVRGIGLISGRSVDDKFVLQPGQESDTRFSYLWNAGREIFGTLFEVELTVRQIIPLQNGQVQLGAETPLRFSGLSHEPLLAGASGPGAGADAPPASAASPSPVDGGSYSQADHCAGMSRPCYDAGPFSATLLGLAGSAVGSGRHHLVRLNVAFKNWSDRELILGYKSGTSGMIDNLGNAYGWGRPGTYDTSVEGIGIVIPGRSSDSRFRLAPGQTAGATFNVIRYNSGRNPIGTSFTFNTVILDLRILPNGQQTEIVREYSLHLPDLKAGGASGAPAQTESLGEAVDKLKNIFKKKKP